MFKCILFVQSVSQYDGFYCMADIKISEIGFCMLNCQKNVLLKYF